jgi:sialate O-acetylesterase
MVLQQEQDVKIWGKAFPNSSVNIVSSWGSTAQTKANKEGDWLAVISTPSAGGPYEINITNGGKTIQLNNILIGEVWICSGQSNMEMPLMGWPPSDPILNSQQEIADANYPTIRLFTVTRALSVEPLTDCEGEWLECNPETARTFSATAYFFGRKLHKELGIPVGLIHSSWGGTPAESWVSKEYIAQMEEFKGMLSSIETSKTSIKILNSWLSDLPTLKVNLAHENPFKSLLFADSSLSKQDFDHNKWPTMELPQNWERTEMGAFDGVIWFRKVVSIPAQWVGKDLTLSLGPIDDMDITYVNGIRIGAYEQDGFWQTERIYQVPSCVVTGEELSIAIRVLDHQGGGGIFGSPEAMKLHPKSAPSQSIPLSGTWNYLPVAEYQGGYFYLFDAESMQYFDRPSLPIDISASTPTLLFNAMINPLLNYTIRGAIWYQGESNVGRHIQYQTLFPLLIECWRDGWGIDDFPFYFVQIAPYEYGQAPSQHIREAQLKTLDVTNTGMVVTLDIGNPQNIHPANKPDVGERLALWALAKDYGKDVVYSGPLYHSMEVQGTSIALTFTYTDGGIVTKDMKLTGFEIAGNNGVFVKANATIKDGKVLVSSPRVAIPVAARYAWDNTTEASLFNGHGLPASSFRTDNWE